MRGNANIPSRCHVLLEERGCLRVRETPVRTAARPSVINEAAKAERLVCGLDPLDLLGQGCSFRVVDVDE